MKCAQLIKYIYKREPKVHPFQLIKSKERNMVIITKSHHSKVQIFCASLEPNQEEVATPIC